MPGHKMMTVRKIPAREIPKLADHLFRHEAGKLVSILTAKFGFDRLQLAEDVVQEALVRALQTWPYHGVPENPTAWLMQTARNLALDTLRREKRFNDKQTEIADTLERWAVDANTRPSAALETEITDNQLRLMFACCHPMIAQDDQIALALKTLCGFGTSEIASAFLISEAAVAKRLTRARQRIRDQQIPFEIPAGEELTDRIDGVLKILYLLFNEGYKATSGDSLVRETLCYEAIRLAALLAGHRAGNQPRSHALLALMCLHAARLPERVDDNGNMLRLQDQNRDNWDKGLIARGIHELGNAASGKNVSEYHLQAGIAALHSTAADYKSTNWPSILKLYDQWIVLDSSPVIALNRAVALAHVHGPQAGIDAVESMPNREQLDGYYLVYAVLGEFMWQLGQWRPAAEMFRQAIKLTTLGSEHTFLSNRLRDCEVCKTPDCMC